MSEQTLPKGAKGKTAKPAQKPPLPEEPLAAIDPSPASAGPAAPAFDAAQLTAEQRAQIEKLSMNLARAALAAQGAIAEMALRQADRPSGLSPTRSTWPPP